MTPPSVAVVGAGIGGLAAALALSRAGFPVTLVERRTGFSEVGAGLQLSPNASRILIDLGLGPALERRVTEPSRVVVRAVGSGREIAGVALGAFMRERFGAPYWVIHRADLQTILLDAVRARNGGDGAGVRLVMGRTVDALENDETGVTLRLARESGARETLRADLAVGADGVWSKARRAVEGPSGAVPPEYQGYVAWRATIPRAAAPAALSGDETGLWLGRRAHVVHYPIAGGREINIVAVLRRAQPVEGWATPGDAAELAAAFGRAAKPLATLLGQAEQWLLWSLYDRPATRMARGRVALLGDAAHPVLPFLAQGAALAIEDAACLARRLAHAQAIGGAAGELAGAAAEEALAGYARERLPRAARVQKTARANGRIYHAGGVVALGRDLTMSRLGPKGLTERYAWLYGWGN